MIEAMIFITSCTKSRQPVDTLVQPVELRVRKKTKMKSYKEMSAPVLLYLREMLTRSSKQAGNHKIQEFRMRFLQQVELCTRLVHIAL